jgi:hypothetical protein
VDFVVVFRLSELVRTFSLRIDSLEGIFRRLFSNSGSFGNFEFLRAKSHFAFVGCCSWFWIPVALNFEIVVAFR